MTSQSLIESFNNANNEDRPALLTYTVAGDPSKEISLEIFKTIANSGVDIIEVGLGHSANVGDGPAIQDCTYRALSNGIKNDDVFDVINSFKSEFETDIIIMTYTNKIMRYGEDNFIKKCVDSNVSGLIVVDYPFPNNLEFSKKCEMNNVTFIQLIAATTSDKRLKEILKESHQILYYMSMSGVTGEKLKASSEEIMSKLNKIKVMAPDKKIILGFGITPENISDFKKTDACVVGSALCREISKSVNEGQNPASSVGSMVKTLRNKLKS